MSEANLGASKQLSLETSEMIMRALKLSSQQTRALKEEQQQKERKVRFVMAAAFLLNLLVLVLITNAPNDGIASASANSEQEVDAVLQRLHAVSAQAAGQSPSNAQMSDAMRSRVTPVVGSMAQSGLTASASTYYGEVMDLKDIARAERAGEVPHNAGQGAAFGAPALPRSQRIDQIIKNRIPLTPEETFYLKSLADDNERAQYASVDVDQRAIKLKYEEGRIPSITVAKNNIATLSFVDRFGNPYPVSSVSPKGAGELFTTEMITHEGTHANVAEIRAHKLNGSSNISVMLVGRTLPAVFKVNLAQSVNDARTVVQFDSVAPGHESVALPQGTGELALCKNDTVIESVLDGVAPSSLQALNTGVAGMMAYQSESHRYIRSLNQIIDPECSCRVYGVDNLNVCKQPRSVPSILYVNHETDEFATLTLREEG